MKKVDIIGGGIAGLALGIHLQKNGIATTIYEKHSVAGGLCTGWQRGDYTFNGCLHWILGTRDGISFYHFWKEIIDIDSVAVDYFDERVEIELPLADRNGSHIFHFINDIDKFEQYLLGIAPEDAAPIKQWARQVRFIGKYLMFLPPVFTDAPWYKSIWFKMKLMRLTPMLFFMQKWARYSNVDFARKFKNPFLNMAIKKLYFNEMRMTVLFFAQAYATFGYAGYPHGGSLGFAQRIAEQYKALGGELRLKSEVRKVLTDNDKACGVELATGERTRADFVASAADWHWTIFDAIAPKYIPETLKPLRSPAKEQIFYSFCMLFLGINADLKSMPHFFRFPIEKITSPDGTEYDQLEVHIYNYDGELAPAGKTTASVNLQTREGEYWISLRHNDIDEYRRKKEELTELIISRLTQKLGADFTERIEVKDLTTPATYNRYTGNYNGSSQGWTPMDNIMQSISVKPTLPRLKNFIMAGHWQKAGGGVPVAVYTARSAAWKICSIFGQKFKLK
ncbi:MAG: NAD(P)/FAD-dependent oxidoreductase [Bacteroidales bacterium]|nr:NAD(P)/FAD-dependent oxidoreductase [Bacteroidales bacterium]